jgi:hypothetical protein
MSITFPIGNKIAEGIAIASNFRAHSYNLKQDLKYLRSNLNTSIEPCAIQWAKEHSIKDFERMLINFTEYNNHPDLIKAKTIYIELCGLINKAV